MSPWGDWNDGRGINGRNLAKILKDYDAWRSASTRRSYADALERTLAGGCPTSPLIRGGCVPGIRSRSVARLPITFRHVTGRRCCVEPTRRLLGAARDAEWAIRADSMLGVAKQFAGLQAIEDRRRAERRSRGDHDHERPERHQVSRRQREPRVEDEQRPQDLDE